MLLENQIRQIDDLLENTMKKVQNFKISTIQINYKIIL